MIRFILFFGFLLHVAVAIWNGFFGPSLGAEGDALNFHNEAVYYANQLGSFQFRTGWIYSYFLGFLYKIFSNHIFFGSMVSVFAWYISALYFIKTMNLLNFEHNKIIYALILFCIWPSALLNSSVTLRESFQGLSIMIILFSSISIFKNRNIGWATLFLGMALGSVLHGSLLVFSAAVALFVFYSFLQIRLGASLAVRIVVTFLIGAPAIFLAYTLFGDIAYDVDDGLVTAVQSFNERASAINARATYREEVYFPSILSFMLFLPVAFFQYMMEPLPNRIGSMGDAVLFMENLVRIALLYVAFAVSFRLNKKSQAVHRFILLSYIAICLIWSIGTVNWGTASRHHAPGLGLLLVAAFYSVSIKERNIAPRRHQMPTTSKA
jgi:hypothetical protein